MKKSSSLYMVIKARGINDLEIKIFPNPTNDILNIKSKTFISEVSVYDLNGRQIITNPINSNSLEYQLNVKVLSNGIYFLEVQSGNSKQTLKFVKN